MATLSIGDHPASFCPNPIATDTCICPLFRPFRHSKSNWGSDSHVGHVGTGTSSIIRRAMGMAYGPMPRNLQPAIGMSRPSYQLRHGWPYSLRRILVSIGEEAQCGAMQAWPQRHRLRGLRIRSHSEETLLVPLLFGLDRIQPSLRSRASVDAGTIWFQEPILPLASSWASRHVSLNPNRRRGPLSASHKEKSWRRGPEHAFVAVRNIEQTPPWRMRGCGPAGCRIRAGAHRRPRWGRLHTRPRKWGAARAKQQAISA
jgi:hypothetical protein